MAEIIPAIIAKDFQEIKKKIRQVEPYTKWIQLDIMDGDFVPNTTWNNPKDLMKMDFSIFLEAHLMISEPEKYVDRWIEVGIKRTIVHIEAVKNLKKIVEKCRQKKVEIGLALNPETSSGVIDDLMNQIDLVLILAVSPGFGGQKFKKETLRKIVDLRQKYPRVKIEVDGGINPETAKKCVKAGADILISGSYIFKSKNIAQAIDKLKNI